MRGLGPFAAGIARSSAKNSYRNAIYRACDRAYPPQGELTRWPKESKVK